MNYNEMTAAQCADWLAEKDGWTWNAEYGWNDFGSPVGCWTRGPYETSSKHPFALTLDAAAGALREPWRWDEIQWWQDGTVAALYVDVRVGQPHSARGPDELTARYRAAVAARMEEER